MKIAVSACLLGRPCRYDGGAKPCAAVLSLAEGNELIPVCPEQLGGLPTPREPSEISDGRVRTKTGADVTAAFEAGAEKALRIALSHGAEAAILKEYSPSCGVRYVYDGSFTGKKAAGSGVFCRMLREAGLSPVSDESIEELENRK